MGVTVKEAETRTFSNCALSSFLLHRIDYLAVDTRNEQILGWQMAPTLISYSVTVIDY